MATAPPTDPTSSAAPLELIGPTPLGDRIFRGVTYVVSVFVLVLIAAIGAFLVINARPAFTNEGVLAFFTRRNWFPDQPKPDFGVAALAFGTLLSSVLALLIAVPIALGSALFATDLAPPVIGRWTGYLVDLLAAVPSVVYGLWGVLFLVPKLVPLERNLDHYLGFIPLFKSPNHTFGRSVFAASVVLAIMIMPIIAAISREVFRQVPRANREAALALGATRWEMIRISVLPYSRGGVIGAIMLGLGRALGETIAVALVLAASFNINLHIFAPGGNTIAANIATRFGDAGVLGRQALIASGVVLFAITLAVNVVARAIVFRGTRSGLGRI